MDPIRKNIGDFIESDVDDETIIVSLASGELLSVKDTGRTVWKLIDGARTRDRIVTLLVAEFGASRQTIEDDVDTFLQSARHAGLIA